jgi:membrane fusion protein (multidrug efflux system)
MPQPKPVKIISAILLCAVVIEGFVYLNRHEADASTQSTDDAYVQAELVTVAPQIAGIIDTVLIEENQTVAAGDLLAVIDARDFTTAMAAAQAQLEGAQANIASQEALLLRQNSVVAQAQAALAADEATLTLAQDNATRYRNLANDGSGTIQALQQAQAQLAIAQATQEKDQAGLQLARQQTDILGTELDQARAALAQAQAALDLAQLKLAHTRITAPVGGVIGRKPVHVGAFVNPGQALLTIVPLEDAYITAHFRETQLARIHGGQAVEITVDALPGTVLSGSVESVGPASGVSYSPIAPSNATGNFTKIVQRLPVRIRLAPDQAATAQLRVGMSVTPTIHVEK